MQPVKALAWYGSNEREILRQFWLQMAEHAPKLIVTHNGLGFDLLSVARILASPEAQEILAEVRSRIIKHIEMASDMVGMMLEVGDRQASLAVLTGLGLFQPQPQPTPPHLNRKKEIPIGVEKYRHYAEVKQQLEKLNLAPSRPASPLGNPRREPRKPAFSVKVED